MVEQYRREIEALHDFFADWYCGIRGEDAFTRVEAVLGPEFEMISPEGDRVERDRVIQGIRNARGQYDLGAFEIEIRNVEVLAEPPEHALVRYEEWQTTPEGDTGRLSTVLFREAPNTPEGIEWVDLQETWLEEKRRSEL